MKRKEEVSVAKEERERNTSKMRSGTYDAFRDEDEGFGDAPIA